MDSAIPKRVRAGRSAPASDRARFEVRGLDRDRTLIRTLARRLAEDGPDAARLRTLVAEAVVPVPDMEAGRVGGIVAALLASPLVGSGIDLSRPRVEPRDIDL